MQHQFREGNAIADNLANVGIDTCTYITYENRADLPTVAKGALMLEKSGLPYLRLKHG